jgi:hypothetical protein
VLSNCNVISSYLRQENQVERGYLGDDGLRASSNPNPVES